MAGIIATQVGSGMARGAGSSSGVTSTGNDVADNVLSFGFNSAFDKIFELDRANANRNRAPPPPPCDAECRRKQFWEAQEAERKRKAAAAAAAAAAARARAQVQYQQRKASGFSIASNIQQANARLAKLQRLRFTNPGDVARWALVVAAVAALAALLFTMLRTTSGKKKK